MEAKAAVAHDRFAGSDGRGDLAIFGNCARDSGKRVRGHGRCASHNTVTEASDGFADRVIHAFV